MAALPWLLCLGCSVLTATPQLLYLGHSAPVALPRPLRHNRSVSAACLCGFASTAPPPRLCLCSCVFAPLHPWLCIHGSIYVSLSPGLGICASTCGIQLCDLASATLPMALYPWHHPSLFLLSLSSCHSRFHSPASNNPYYRLIAISTPPPSLCHPTSAAPQLRLCNSAAIDLSPPLSVPSTHRAPAPTSQHRLSDMFAPALLCGPVFMASTPRLRLCNPASAGLSWLPHLRHSDSKY